MPAEPTNEHTWETCILAGGLSSRMGRDKARLRLGRRTLLGWVRETARDLGQPVRVIRRDSVPRCGPLGGLVTALRSSHAEAVLFLSCDMPFVSVKLLKALGAPIANRGCMAAFVQSKHGAGFPCALRREALGLIEELLKARRFSLQGLASALNAELLSWPKRRQHEIFNINTPVDWAVARSMAAGSSRPGSAPSGIRKRG